MSEEAQSVAASWLLTKGNRNVHAIHIYISSIYANNKKIYI